MQLRRDVVDGVGAKLNSLGKLIVRGEVHDDLGGLYRVAILAVVGVGGPGTCGTACGRVVVELRFLGVDIGGTKIALALVDRMVRLSVRMTRPGLLSMAAKNLVRSSRVTLRRSNS